MVMRSCERDEKILPAGHGPGESDGQLGEGDVAEGGLQHFINPFQSKIAIRPKGGQQRGNEPP
jgi:hypothetical protein